MSEISEEPNVDNRYLGGLTTKHVQVQPFNREHHTARVQAYIAGGLLIIMLLLITFTFVTVWVDNYSSKEVIHILGLLFGPVVSLSGLAIGFYFGERSAEQRLTGSQHISPLLRKPGVATDRGSQV